MIVLGLNTFHSNSSASIIINGKIVASAEEERFVRIKNYKGFPVAAINFCLNYCNLTINNIDIISVNHNRYYNFIPKSILYFIIQKNEPQTNPFSKVALQYDPNKSEFGSPNVKSPSGWDIENNITVWDATDKKTTINKLYQNIPDFNNAFYYIEEDYLEEKDNIYKRTGIWV